MEETAYPNKWKILIAVQLAIFMCTFEISVVNLALPVIQEIFNAPLERVKWVAVIYSATVALTLPITAYLGRRFGTVKVYRVGQLLFTIATIGCGLSNSLEMLFVLRFLSGVGAAFLLSLNRVVALGAFPSDQHGMALGFSGSTFALGIVSGLAAGGVLIETVGWQSVFFVNILPAIPMLFLSWLTLRHRTLGIEQEKISFDVKGMALTIGALGGCVYGVTHWVELFTAFQISHLVVMVGTMGLIYMWLRHEFNENPSFLNLHILKHFPLPYNFINAAFVRFGIGALNFIVPFYLQSSLGLSPLRASIVLCSGAIATGISGPFAGKLIDTIGPMQMLRLGFGFICAGCLCYTLLPHDVSTKMGLSIAIIVFAQLLIGTGSVCFSGAFMFSSLRSVSKQLWASISSLQSVVMMAGSAIGATVAADLVGTWAGNVSVDQVMGSRGFFILFILLTTLVGGQAIFSLFQNKKNFDAASECGENGSRIKQ